MRSIPVARLCWNWRLSRSRWIARNRRARQKQSRKMHRIRLLLLDDHILFREGLRRLLVSEPDFETVAECGTPAEALDSLSCSAVDVVLLDFDLEDDTGTRFITSATVA